jgi:3-deoxy-manno-octulosonate cytidylyltransferase (CMP-KDO synthetase)
MVEHVYRRAADARGVDAVVVATDDGRIADAVTRFGGVVRMTSAAHRTGTDRIAEVARDLSCEILINVQGDEPLIDPQTIAAVGEPLRRDSTLKMSTACTPLADAAEHANRNVVKVVRDVNGDALYFSRASIAGAWKHLGLYAYRRDFLLEFAALAQTPLEIAESLEQLRALEHGVRIRTVATQYDSVGVDTPADLERARRTLMSRDGTSYAATRAGEVA